MTGTCPKTGDYFEVVYPFAPCPFQERRRLISIDLDNKMGDLKLVELPLGGVGCDDISDLFIPCAMESNTRVRKKCPCFYIMNFEVSDRKGAFIFCNLGNLLKNSLTYLIKVIMHFIIGNGNLNIVLSKPRLCCSAISNHIAHKLRQGFGDRILSKILSRGIHWRLHLLPHPYFKIRQVYSTPKAVLASLNSNTIC